MAGATGFRLLFIIWCLILSFQGIAMPPIDSLSYFGKRLDSLKRADSATFNTYALLCLQQRQYQQLIGKYRDLLDNGKKVLELSDLPHLRQLHAHINLKQPNDNAFFTCLFLGRVLVKYHVNQLEPLTYFNEAVDIAQRLSNKCFYVKAVYGLSSYWGNIRHDLLKDYECMTLIDSFYKVHGEQAMLDCNVDHYVGYSVMYYYLEDCPQGIDYLNRSLRIFGKTGKPQKIFDLYARRALMEAEDSRYAEALHSLDSAGMAITNVPRNGIMMNNLAADSLIIFVKMGEFEQAEILSRKVDPLSLDVGNDEFYDYLYNLTKLNLRQKKYAEAARNIALFDRDIKPWNIQRLRNLSEMRYLLSRATGKTEDALRFYEEYTRYNDSVHHQRQHYAVLGQQIKYNTIQKEKDLNNRIGLLQQQNKIRALYLGIVVVILAMTIVIVILVFRNYKRGKKNIEQLTELNGKVLQQKAELETKNKEKDRILNVVAHDLRSPVGNVVYLSDMMQMEGGSSLGTEKAVGMIKSASENALTLINELLVYNNDLKTELIRAHLNMDALLSDTVAEAQIKAKNKEVNINYTCLAARAITNGSFEKLSRVVTNLLDNAIKFSPRGGSIVVKLYTELDNLIVTVTDNGIGIPTHLQAELFDMLTPAKRPGTEGEKSYGLGLSICKQIIEAHDGVIAVKSSPEEGATFTILLPLAS